MFLVTFHGGKDGIEQVYSYAYDGTGGAPYLTQATPSGKNGFRDLQFLPFERGGLFYLVNSSKEASEVFQIEPDATSVPPPFVNGVGGMGTGPELCSVYHPFSIALNQAMTVCYIACQDSNVVVRVGGPNSTNPGQPLDINSSLPPPSQGEAYLPGTFVASQIPLVPAACRWPDKQTPPAVKSHDGGLNASPSDLKPDETPDNSVRGVALLGHNLDVADEVDNCIRTYDVETGAYEGKLADPNGLVSSPTHLLVSGPDLYVSVKPHKGNADAAVLHYSVSGAQTLSAQISNSDDLNVEAPAGMTFDGNGNFYLADRTARVVYKFDSNGNLAKGNPFIADMPDDPEFILWVNDDWLPGAS